MPFTTNLAQPLKWAKLRDKQRLALYDLMVAAWHRQGLPDNYEKAAEAAGLKPDLVKPVWTIFRTHCVIREGRLMFAEMWAAVDRKDILQERGRKAGEASGEARQAQKDLLIAETKQLEEQAVTVSPVEAIKQLEEENDSEKPDLKDLKKHTVTVFNYWKQTLRRPGAMLTPLRERRIRARLSEGYTVAQLKKAIDGNLASPFHRGENADGKVWDDIELILRDGEHVEAFIELVKAKEQRVGSINGNGSRSFGSAFVASVCGYSYSELCQSGGKVYQTVVNTGKWIDERHVRLAASMPGYSLDAELFKEYWQGVLRFTGLPKPETVPRYFKSFVDWQEENLQKIRNRPEEHAQK